MDAKFRIIRSMACGVAVSVFWLGITVAESTGQISLERPGDREFMRDLAGILDEESKEEIKSTCDKLLTEKATPIIVVTIDSMSALSRHARSIHQRSHAGGLTTSA